MPVLAVPPHAVGIVPNSRRLLLLAALLAVPVLFCNGYYFGLNNHLSRLPLVLRALDPAWAAGDFYVDAASAFSVRMVFTGLVTALAQVLPLPAIYLFLAWLAIAATLAVTGLCAADLFASERAAAVAVILVAATNNQRHLLSADLAWPLAFAALWCAFRLRPALGCTLAAGGALLHPGIGLVAGALALAITALSLLVSASARARGVRLAAAWLAGAGVLLAALAFWRTPYQMALSDAEFVRIFAVFRNPGHVLASELGIRAFASLGAALAAYAWSWAWWRRAGADDALARRVAIALVLLLALFAGGVVFVEVIPTRFWALLQAFRFFRVFHWIGLLLVAATAARLLDPHPPRARWRGPAFLLASLGTAPMLGAHVAAALAERGGRRAVRRAAGAAGLAVLALALAWPFVNGAPDTVVRLVKLVVGLALAWCLAPAPTRRARAAAGVVLAAGVSGAVVAAGAYDIPGLSRLLAERAPVFSIDQLRRLERTVVRDDSRVTPDLAAVAAAIRAQVPAGGVVLAPPGEAVLRLLADRALVVDFKCYPHQDTALLAWYLRLEACYGPTTARGFRAQDEMDAAYRRLSVEEARTVARRFGATAAVLYVESLSGERALYANDTYALIDLGTGSPAAPQ